MKISSLGYIKTESPDAKQWIEFGPEVLGMALAEETTDDRVLLAVDDRHHRLSVQTGERNRLLAMGWETASVDDFEESVEHLEREGIAVERGTSQDLEENRVRALARFTDPLGFSHEIFYGGLVDPLTFRPGRNISGFVTGEQGLGHLVMIVPDPDEIQGFFRRTLGFRPTDDIDMHFNDQAMRMKFFHVNPRHHSFAMAEMPGHRGMHHIMLEVASLDDVGKTYDLCKERGVPVVQGIGRHTNDRMVSFYLRTPGGFEIEYGWGGIDVNDETWVTSQYTTSSIWGHKIEDNLPMGCVEEL